MLCAVTFPLSLQANKNRVVASGTYVPPKTVSRQVAAGKPVKQQVASSSGIFVPPSNGTGLTADKSRKRKLEEGAGEFSVSVCVCVPSRMPLLSPRA